MSAAELAAGSAIAGTPTRLGLLCCTSRAGTLSVQLGRVRPRRAAGAAERAAPVEAASRAKRTHERIGTQAACARREGVQAGRKGGGPGPA
eukprot:scaffold206095_cov31-Tisochrysis_lutea.AAC.2